MFRILENHQLELFSLHSFQTCFDTKTIYEINMCKNQYKKDLKKTLRFTGRINEALVNNDNTIFIITVSLFVVFIFFVPLTNLLSTLRISRFGFSFFFVQGSLFLRSTLVSLILTDQE